MYIEQIMKIMILLISYLIYLGGKSINEINNVDKNGEKQRVYNTLRRIIPQYIPIIGGPE